MGTDTLSQSKWETCKQAGRKVSREADNQTVGQTGKQASRQAGGQVVEYRNYPNNKVAPPPGSRPPRKTPILITRN